MTSVVKNINDTENEQIAVPKIKLARRLNLSATTPIGILVKNPITKPNYQSLESQSNQMSEELMGKLS